MSAWGTSTYHGTGQALGVRSMAVYPGPEARTGRWVSAWGYELLPVAALFDVVRSSGVVGVDVKYVLVPKSDKPAGEIRRWSLRSALPKLLRLPEYRNRAGLPGCLREALPSDALLRGCPAACPG